MRTAFVYLVLSILCALFGAVYESCSHGVFSFYMIYAFAYPLVLGALPYFILAWRGVKALPGVLARSFYHSGIATLTVGSLVKGVLEIYGTTNHLSGCYFPVGVALTAAGIVIYLAQITISAKSK